MTYRKGMMRQHGGELSVFHRTLDAAIIFAALMGWGLGYGADMAAPYGVAGLVSVIVFLILAEWNALYHSWRASGIKQEAWSITSVWFLTCCTLLAFGFLSKSSVQFSRVAVIGWVISIPILLVIERVMLRSILRAFRSQGYNSRSVAIVGSGAGAEKLVEEISHSSWMGLRVTGIYYEDYGDDIVNNDSSLIQRAKAGEFDSIYIAYPMSQEEKIRELVEKLADCTASVYIVPDLFVSNLFHARWTSLGMVPVVSVFESPILGINSVTKRIEDVVLGTLILLLLSPPMLLVAIAIKLTSRGPVLFKQSRYGLNGEVIAVWKFRSMTVCENDMDVPQAKREDPRITPLGGFLRRTSLDELPQFINVLQGTMSIVGPRPHAVAHNEQYRKQIYGYMLRHKVKPGITGWAQVNGWRGETNTLEKMQKRVEHDLYYINNWSLWLDIKIILMTIFKVAGDKNAY